MKTTKTQNLTGAALDWAVAKCEYDELAAKIIQYPKYAKFYPKISPSTNWAQGGPIIERESIRLTPDQGDTYVECVWFAGSANDNGDEFNGEGVTPLIAAMRCYVASKMGDEVEVPDEVTA